MSVRGVDKLNGENKGNAMSTNDTSKSTNKTTGQKPVVVAGSKAAIAAKNALQESADKRKAKLTKPNKKEGE